MRAFDPDRSSAIRTALVDHVSASARRTRWRPRIVGTALLASGMLLGAGTTAAIALSASGHDEHVASSALTMETFRQLSEPPGFVSGGPASSDSDALVIYWSGPMKEASDIAERVASEGVHVRFEAVLRTPDELWSDAINLTDELTTRGIDVTGFGPNRDYTGIELMGPELSIDPDLQETVTEVAEDLLGPAIDVTFLPNETGLTFPATTPADD